MRLLVVASCVAAITTGPALGCPRNVLCVIQPDVTAAREVPRAPAPTPRTSSLRAVAPHPTPRVRLTFDRPARPDPGDIEMPWIWRMLRERVVSQLPNHRTRSLSLTLAPVVVTTPAETVPGVGLAGDF